MTLLEVFGRVKDCIFETAIRVDEGLNRLDHGSEKVARDTQKRLDAYRNSKSSAQPASVQSSGSDHTPG